MNERAPIEVIPGPDTIRVVGSAINDGAIPGVYVTDGELSMVEHVSGTANPDAGDRDRPLPVTSITLTPARLALALAQHAEVYKVVTRADKKTGETTSENVEITPPSAALQAILAARTWPGVPALRGIVGAPVLRADGTLLQHRGYDKATGLYLAPAVPMRPVPDEPTPEDAAEARGFLLDQFLRDFPWAEEADKANHVGLMVTPILRRYLGSPVPFGVITANMPGSGKTILTSSLGLLNGQRVMPWPDNDVELRKLITSSLGTVEGTMIFDNLAEGAVIGSAVLANLITTNVWSDRLLGSNKVTAQVNDRMWLATGNNLATGGDMGAGRTVAVRLASKTAHPERRTDFELGDLTLWIEQPENRERLLRCLLVMVLDWTRAGAPKRADVTGMRQFTPWAQGVGGFLEHHGIPGFLDNAEAFRAEDADDGEWTAFLHTWRARFGDARKLAADVISDATDSFGQDQWHGTFVTTPEGRRPTPKTLGRMLGGQVDHPHSGYVLRKARNPATKILVWWVETTGEETGPAA